MLKPSKLIPALTALIGLVLSGPVTVPSVGNFTTDDPVRITAESICAEVRTVVETAGVFTGFQVGSTLPATSAAVESGSESGAGDSSLVGLGLLGVLGLGLLFGLKHATEADHVVAVSSIVSEHRNVLKAALVGGLWGIGHTVSIVTVGFVVLLFRVAIPKSLADWLEFGVAFMIIGLGVKACASAMAARTDGHSHADDAPADSSARVDSKWPHFSGFGVRPLLVGAAHGLAGSAALTVLVLSQISSMFLGVTYLAVFGLGTVGGMLLMSGLIGLPFVWSARGKAGFHYGLRLAVGTASILFGLWYAYRQSDVVYGLFTL
jgi:hypothetical protein